MQLYDMGDLAESRADAEEGMTDWCVVSRSGDGRTFNPETGQYESAGASVYEGKCRIRAVRSQPATSEAGLAVYTVERVELQLPFGATFHLDDVAECTDSAMNADLIGQKYRVTGLGRMSHASAQRLSVEVIS